MSDVEAMELYQLKWRDQNTFLTRWLYEQCRVSEVIYAFFIFTVVGLVELSRTNVRSNVVLI